MDITTALLASWLLLAPSRAEPQTVTYDPARLRFYEAMSAAGAAGLPALVEQLDAIAAAHPSSGVIPLILETIQTVGLLHPGAVPDSARRFEAMKAQAAANPAIAAVVRQMEVLREYFAAAPRALPESSVQAAANPVIQGSRFGLIAQADAAFRSGDYDKTEDLCLQVIEADPVSPLLANAHTLLGLCSAYRGDMAKAAGSFRAALRVAPLQTIYGRPQEYLAVAFRFARPMSGAGDKVFPDVSLVPIAGIQELKDPRALHYIAGRFVLLDRDQIITLAQDGKASEAKAVRQMQDFAAAGTGTSYYLAEDSLDAGSGGFLKLSVTVAGKKKDLENLRSLAVDSRGDLYLLDQDHGLFRALPAAKGAPSISPVAAVRGRLLRIDRRGYLYVLSQERRNILVLSRSGKQLALVTPSAPAGKSPSVEHFALDSLNHIYILEAESNSIQIFAVNNNSRGLEAVPVTTLALEARPQFKDLKVLALSDTGEMALTGKNADTWILYK